MLPKYSVAAVPHLFDQSPPSPPHPEGEVGVELQEVGGDVGDVRQEPGGRQGGREQRCLF